MHAGVTVRFNDVCVSLCVSVCVSAHSRTAITHRNSKIVSALCGGIDPPPNCRQYTSVSVEIAIHICKRSIPPSHHPIATSKTNNSNNINKQIKERNALHPFNEHNVRFSTRHPLVLFHIVDLLGVIGPFISPKKKKGRRTQSRTLPLAFAPPIFNAV